MGDDLITTLSTQLDVMQHLEGVGEERVGYRLAPDYEQTGHYFAYVGRGRWEEHWAVQHPVGVALASTIDLARHARVRADDPWPYVRPLAYVNEDAVSIHHHRAGGVDQLGKVGEPADRGVVVDGVTLRRHPVFNEVVGLNRGRIFTQRELVRWLRTSLNGYVDEVTISIFRSLRLINDGTTDTVIAKGREAIDRRINQAVQAAGGDVPDEITVVVPVYDLAELRNSLAAIRVIVETEIGKDDQAKFLLTVVADDVYKAIEAAQEEVRANLAEALIEAGVEMHIFRGSPETDSGY